MDFYSTLADADVVRDLLVEAARHHQGHHLTLAGSERLKACPQRLRKKIAEATGGHHYIETVWGRGYVLRDPAAPWAAGASTLDENLAERIRAVLAGTGSVREVRMFGGLCFILNGNMVAGASKRGLLARVGKDQHTRALARPDAKRMEMSGRPMEGYVLIDPPPRDEQTLREWLDLAVAFVNALPAKSPRLRSRRAKAR
jgi:TfoX/Sxy family transcriptional regulator of competence genes